ncbi:calcitonin gene-related peptide type 1 receptor-like isoform X1 [Branchiostoma lanceolatum]|uniref:calcitonin gene-related peptide type 1 receptor-like isoform X1 n=1 Tax=Branchiostoma lanceolatum TaxID=7740 RepID=UPI0034532C50
MIPVFTIIIIIIGGLGVCRGQSSQPTVKGLTLEQKKMMTSQYECYMKMMTDPPFEGEGVFCNRTWDGWGCWGDTPAGTVAELNCPDFFPDFDTSLRASKTCMRDGSWYRHPESNRSWSDYTICNANTRQHQQRHLSLLYITLAGYGLSLIALVVSLGIFFYFKSLSCPRITIHKNLFFAFILNSILWIIWFTVVVPDNELLKQNPVSCRVLHVLTQYALGCNYFWMLCEGIYLHTLIVVAVFSEKGSLLWYYLLGWGFPAIPTIIYTVVRSIYADDKECWINASTKLLYVNQGPIIAALLVNLFFLLNILRVLITKLRATNTPETNSYRKAVRATLILVPLLGVQFVVVPFRPTDGTTAEVIYDYASTVLMNYQGLFVALIYCFFNGEVIGQVKRKWRNFQAERNRGGRYSQHRGSHSQSFFAATTTTTTGTELVPFNPAHKNDTNGSHMSGLKMPMIPEKDSLEERMEENSV